VGHCEMGNEMTEQFFYGFAIGAFTSFTMSMIFFSVKWHELYEENKSLRIHPSRQLDDPNFEILGEWGSALDGWVDDE